MCQTGKDQKTAQLKNDLKNNLSVHQGLVNTISLETNSVCSGGTERIITAVKLETWLGSKHPPSYFI